MFKPCKCINMAVTSHCNRIHISGSARIRIKNRPMIGIFSFRNMIGYQVKIFQSTGGSFGNFFCSLDPLPVYKRSEEHTSELQSLMRISYDVLCLKKKKITHKIDDSVLSMTQSDYYTHIRN